MSTPEQKLFTPSAVCAAAFPIPAIQVAAAFGELARLNLSMYEVVLAGARENRETVLLSTTVEPPAWHHVEAQPSLTIPFTACRVALTVLMLQTAAALNRLALDGCAEMDREATAAIAAMGRSARAADAAPEAASQVFDDARCSTAATPPGVAPDIALDAAGPAAGAEPRAGRRQNPSSRHRASS